MSCRYKLTCRTLHKLSEIRFAFYRDPNGILDTAVLRDNIDKMVDLGLLKSGIDAKKYVDLGLVREAGARLK